MKLKTKKSKWLTGMGVALIIFLGLLFFGFIGIPAKCYYHTSTQDVKFCHAFYQAEYWEERQQETWRENIYVKGYFEEFVIEPGAYVIEKAFFFTN